MCSLAPQTIDPDAALMKQVLYGCVTNKKALRVREEAVDRVLGRAGLISTPFARVLFPRFS